MALTGLAAAYSATGAAWEEGPGRVYNRLAEVVVAASPAPLAGGTVVDIGAGTGAASRAIAAAGARAIAVDAALGMLAAGRVDRPPAAQADALALPFPDGALDGAVAAFSMNHLPDPAAGLREAARVVRAGGAVVASSYAEDDGHPVKAAVEAAMSEAGWAAEPWVSVLRTDATPRLATVERCEAAAREAGLDAAVMARRVELPELGPADLVAWRLGMAQHAPFVAGVAPAVVDRVRARALELLGDAPPLVRSVIVIAAVV